jgi:DNA end-binding protein Ku
MSRIPVPVLARCGCGRLRERSRADCCTACGESRHTTACNMRQVSLAEAAGRVPDRDFSYFAREDGGTGCGVAVTRAEVTLGPGPEPGDHNSPPGPEPRPPPLSPIRRPGMTSVFTGIITLGVLQIPIRLVSCVRDESFSFKQLTPCHTAQVTQRTFCRECDDQVNKSDLLKGYELEKGKFVVLTAEEIEQAALPISKEIEIEVCVPESRVDFRYFDKPYLVLPPPKDAGRLYALLRAALASTGHVAIGRIVLRTKQHIAAVRVLGDFLAVHLMHWPDEVPDLAEYCAPEVEVKPGELRLAETLVAQLAGEFTPESFVDQHRENLFRIIAAKARGEAVTFEAKTAPAPAGDDVLALLEASIAADKTRREAA